MIVLRISDLDLGSTVTHVSTDWQVSRDVNFSDIVTETFDDTANLTSVVYNDILDPTIKYYARARVLLTTGYTAWGNIDMFTPKDINDLDVTLDIPSNITLPTLTSSSSVDNHAYSIFTLTATGFNIVGNSKHTSTSWLIEDINNSVVWSSMNDTYNLTSIEVTSIILPPSSVYRVRAMFHSSTGDTSQVSTLTITTSGVGKVRVITPLAGVNTENDLRVGINPYPGITHTEWELYGINTGISTKVWSLVRMYSGLYEVNIPKEILSSQTRYILKVKTNLDTNWIHEQFSTY